MYCQPTKGVNRPPRAYRDRRTETGVQRHLHVHPAGARCVLIIKTGMYIFVGPFLIKQNIEDINFFDEENNFIFPNKSTDIK